MALRDSAVRLRLIGGGFLSGLDQLGDKATEVGKRIGRAFKGPTLDGLNAAKNSISETASGMKSMLSTALTLGGAISGGALAKGALDLQKSYRDIAFNVNKIPGNLETAESVQKTIEGSADRTRQKTEDMAAAYMDVFEATGDLEFTKASLDAIGTAATASGEEVGVLGNAAQLLARKFAVTKEQLPEALTRLIEKAGVGGLKLEDLSDDFALVAGEAAGAFKPGLDGISQLMGLMVQLDNAVGEAGSQGLKQLVERFRDGSSDIKGLMDASGLKFEVDETLFEKLEKVFASEKGRKAAEASITGEARVVFDELAKPFDEAVQTAKAEGKKGKELRDSGIEAFRSSLDTMSKSSMTFAQIQDEAAKRAATDPSIKLRAAIDSVQRAVAQPEMIEAFNQLAAHAPALARGFGRLMEFAVNNPLLAGAGFVGGKAALAAGTSFATSATVSFAKSSVKGVGEMISADVAKSSKWAVAGKALGVAAGAAIVFAIGKEMIDREMEEQRQQAFDLSAAATSGEVAAMQGSETSKRRALATLKERVEAEQKERQETKHGFLNMVTLGGYAAVKDSIAGGDDALLEAQFAIVQLERSLKKSEKGGEDAGKALSSMVQPAKQLSESMRQMAASQRSMGDANGLPPNAQRQPGFAGGT